MTKIKSVVTALLVGAAYSSSSWGWTLVTSEGQGWASGNLTIHWNFTQCTNSQTALLADLDAAVAAWNAANGANLSLTRAATASTDDANAFLAGVATDVPLLVCDSAFTADTSADADSIPASTRLSNASGPIDYGGVLINAEVGKLANIQNITDNQITVIMAHELGHVLGLGHSSVPEALMYYAVNAKNSPNITEDDLDGISFLYPRNEFSGHFFGCNSVANSHEPPATSAILWGSLSIALWLGLTLLFGRKYRFTVR